MFWLGKGSKTVVGWGMEWCIESATNSFSAPIMFTTGRDTAVASPHRTSASYTWLGKPSGTDDSVPNLTNSKASSLSEDESWPRVKHRKRSDQSAKQGTRPRSEHSDQRNNRPILISRRMIATSNHNLPPLPSLQFLQRSGCASRTLPIFAQADTGRTLVTGRRWQNLWVVRANPRGDGTRNVPARLIRWV
jgi:hypothetical protein